MIVLILVNTYPLFVARQLTFNSKQTTLQNQVSVILASVTALETYSVENVTQVLRLLDIEGVNRVLVVDSSGETLYERRIGNAEAYHEDWAVPQALSGNDVFSCRFKAGVYESCAAGPFYQTDRVAGAVYLFEADPDQGAILLELQKTIRLASLVILLIGMTVSVLFSHTLTSRIRKLLKGIRQVREGDYGFRVNMNGHDEMADLGDEFDSLAERLQTTEEARRRFVSDASHELKTPLASIRLLSDSILQNPEVDTSTVMEFVRDIGGESERLARTTEKLLSLTRFDNKILSKPVRVNVSVAADGALQILKPIAAERNVSILCDLGSDCYALCSEDDIYQVVINLVENAIKYNVRGGKVHVRTVRQGDDILLVVADTGIGIPEANLPYIFDRFYRVDKARSRETGGSGLGLSIVKSIADEHGGSVTAERRRQGGMRFTITFPYCPADNSDVDRHDTQNDE